MNFVFLFFNSLLDFGCGQVKLSSLVLTNRADCLVMTNRAVYVSAAVERGDPNKNDILFHWNKIDQSPNMSQNFQEECVDKSGKDIYDVEVIDNGDPRNNIFPTKPTVMIDLC